MSPNSQNFIEKLKKSGSFSPLILDILKRIVNKSIDIPSENAYPSAKLLELLLTKNQGNVLVLGKFPLIIYFILGNNAKQLYTIEDTPEESEKMLKILKKNGFGNVHFITHRKWDEYRPYQNILMETSKNEEPEDLIDVLREGGTLVIKRLENTNEIVKITKTHSGFIKEKYSEKYCRHN